MNHKCEECGAEFDKPDYRPPEYHMGPDFYLCPECGGDVTDQVKVRVIDDDAANHPENLHDSKEVWDDEWNHLLKGIDGD